MKRKLLSAALALVMCLCLFPGAALAAEGDELDLSNADTDKTGSGYSWTASSKTLTLDDGFSAAKVTLPDDAVTIVTAGTNTIGTLEFKNSNTINLTFSGEGTLTVSQQINIASGDYNTLTVNDKANVIANGGIYIGETGGVNSIVTIEGTLTANGGEGIAAIHAGSVAVGNTGILNVSGNEGVLLAGMPRNTDKAYYNLFTVVGEGRFTANCSDYNIRVQLPENPPEGTTAQAAIPLGPEYLPADCEVRLNEEHANQIDLVRISTGEIYKGAITIHLNHDWNRDSWEKDDTGHWHPCRFSGCDKQDSYAVHELDWQKDENKHWQKCTVCGYETAQEAHSLSQKYSDTSHWQECASCGYETTHEAHSLIEKNDGTGSWQECTKCSYTTKPQSHRLIEKYDEDNHWQECMECDYETEAEPHSFSLQYDGAEHWRECGECGCKIEVAPHVYDNDNDASCNICGYTRTIGGPIDGGFMGDYFSDWSSVSAYAVTVAGSEHGKVSADCARASGGSAVTLTVAPDGGYELDVLTVADSRGNAVRVIARSGGKYAFTMPDRDVTVSAVFAPLPEEPDDAQKPCDGGEDCPSRGFTDLGSVEAWYHAAVDYVLQSGLMSGYGEGLFGPDDNLSRAQFAQILYNREGKPAATGLGAFTDVAPEAWYAPAIAWAAERGVVSGGGMFGPDDSITREQLAVMLWRYAGSPAAAGGELRFTDAGKASGYALEALRWAVEAGVMRGDGGFLNPGGLATRAQTAEILMNYFK